MKTKKPKRIQLSRKKGWKMPDNTAKVDRSTKWGNPFRPRTGKITREESAHMFFLMMTSRFCAGVGVSLYDQQKYFNFAQHAISNLAGRNLACWCPMHSPCHADVLLVCANKIPIGEEWPEWMLEKLEFVEESHDQPPQIPHNPDET